MRQRALRWVQSRHGCQGAGRRRRAHSIASYRAAALTAGLWHSQWGWNGWREREAENQNWFY